MIKVIENFTFKASKLLPVKVKLYPAIVGVIEAGFKFYTLLTTLLGLIENPLGNVTFT